MQNITIGKYVPYNSIIHRLDPRYKILAMIVLMVCIFFSFSSIWMNFIVYGILMIFIYIIMRISHIKLSMLFSQLKAIWIMMFVLFIVNIIVPGDASLGYFTFFNTGWKIYYSAIYNTVYILFRLIIMLSLSLILTATTKPLELTNALEFLMKPLKVIKFPVHEIAMTISLALRFIPTLLEETDRIMKAQASRGVDFQNGKFKEKIKAIIALIIPLFISALARSEDLANAMEARGYNPSAKRTKYRINKWALRDSIASVIILLILGGLITLMVTNFDLVTFIQGLF